MLRLRSAGLVAAAIAAALALGCDAASYAVVVRFEPPALADRAARVEVAVVPSCTSQVIGDAASGALREVEIVRMSAPAPLGDLEPGRYGLYARALDASCRVVAAGCDPIDVIAGGSGALSVTATAVDRAACAPGSRCEAGRCEGPAGDAGRPDGGCACPSCADCDGSACVPVHARCGAAEVCDPRLGCVAATACGDAEPRCPDDGDPCTLARCDETRDPPLCVAEASPDTTACAVGGRDGQCRDGACCTGCWGPGGCTAGTELASCGGGGVSCEDCDDASPCTDDLCAATGCVHTPNDANACPGGTCHAGSCCTGCWDGAGCQSGDEIAACGASGAACAACACPTPACGAGACEAAHLAAHVSGGPFHTCAVTRGGQLYCWGDNGYGQLGTGAVGVGAEELAPARIGLESDWIVVECAEEHCCGIRAIDQLWCWGGNSDGQLGFGDYVARQLPSQVPGAWSELFPREDKTFARRTDGTLWVFGENDDGDLGLGTTADVLTPTLLPPPTGAAAWGPVALGWEHACAIDSTGRLFCWGANDLGQLGIGTSGSTDQLTPAQVGTDTDWADVTAGQQHTCARKDDGSLFCWGTNSNGQLGIGTSDTTPHTLPEQSGTSTDWAEIVAGEDHCCGLTTGGALRCWGENEYGQLGLGFASTTSTRTATAVGTATDWVQASAGEDHTCGIRSDGTLYCWGRNDALAPSTAGGQLGLGDRLPRDVPSAVCFPR